MAVGGGMIRLAALLLAAALFLVGARSEEYVVGGDDGWTVPRDPSTYADWVRGKTFKVDDVLDFRFQTGQHDVTTVTRQAYESCTKAYFLNQITTGPAKVRLNTVGPHYFICTVDGHCSLGQKLAINVTRAGSSTSGGL